VKSNMGHAQAAAGVAGVIKMVLAMRHQVLPRTLHAEEKSQHIDWSQGAVRLLTEPADWPAGERIRRAGVSSFGISGTNAHIVLEEAPPRVDDRTGRVADAPAAVPWVVSGRGAAALHAQAARLHAYLAARPDLDLADAGFSLAMTRTAFSHRAVITGAARDELLAGLAAVAAGTPAPNVVAGTVTRERATVFVFPGEVPGWAGRAARLLEESPVFAARLAECDQALVPVTGWSVAAVLRGEPGAPSPDGPGVAGPALFAVTVSLAALWRSAGIEPAAVIGIGPGEIAAAHLAGALPLAAAAAAAARAETGTAPDVAGSRASAIPVFCALDSVPGLAVAGPTVFIEVSPDPVLAAKIRDALDGAGGQGPAATVTGTVGDEGGLRSFLANLAVVYVGGTPVDWSAVFAGSRRRIGLPTYAFQRQRFWPAPSREASRAPLAEQRFWAAVKDKDLVALAELLGSGQPLREDMPLGEALALLSSWRGQDRQRPETRGLRYQVNWKAVVDPPPALTGMWLVVAHAGPGGDGELTAAVSGALIRHRADVTVVRPAIAERSALAAQLKEALRPDELAGVVSLLAAGEQEPPGLPGVSAAAAATLALIQALGDTATPAPLWVLTRDAVRVADADPAASPARAQVWGLGRAAALEHPDRWGGLIDLPAADDMDERAAARLCGLLSAASGEDQAAIRPAGIFARRLMHAPRPPEPARPWKPRGTALVTGGTGSRGGHVARWLARGGAEHVVLASRSGPHAPGAAALAAGVAAAGARVTVTACDVAVRDSVAALIRQAAAEGPPLTTVVHAAGTGQATPLADTSVTDFGAVAGAKAGGATHLDELTRQLDLDAFILFSSGSGVWGSGGQAAYAAANAYLDALAARRRARGQAAVSVAWGLWAGSGMAEAEGGERLRRRGLGLMAPDLAVEALRQAVEHDETLVTVADMDWERFIPVFTAARPSPLLGDLPEAANLPGISRTRDPGGGEPEWARRLGGLPRQERGRLLLDLVRAQTAVVLGYSSADLIDSEGDVFESADLIDSEGDVFESGMTSMSAVELRTNIIKRTGLKLPEGLIYDLYTPTAIADFVLAEFEAQRHGGMPGD
jgi:acyl transferase domain-containing protein